MAADCGLELRKHNVACVSLWPGSVKTENIVYMLKKTEEEGNKVKNNEDVSVNVVVGGGGE